MTKKIEKKPYDLKSLEKAVNSLVGNSKTVGLALLKNAVYIDGKLDQLKADIDLNGLNVQMQQGDYFITKKNPSVETFDKFYKAFRETLKEIKELIKNESTEADDGWEDK